MNSRKWKSMIIVAAVLCCSVLTFNVMAADEAAGADKADVAASVDQSSQSFDNWVDSVKNPTDWISWGADLRLRLVGINNWRFLNDDVANDQDVFTRIRGRVWTKINAGDVADVNVKITYEGRYWWEPELAGPGTPGAGWDQRSVVWDSLNAVFTDVAGQPLKITIGRQNLIKGTGWLVLEGTPLDGSRTIFNDAIALDYVVDDATTISAIYLQNHALNDDAWIPAIDNKNDPLTEEDERGVILWLNKKIEGKTVDGYFIYEHDDAVLGSGNNGDYYTVGGSVGDAINDNWSYRAEGAYQWGVKDMQDLSAGGINTQLVYAFNNDAKSSLRFDFEMLTGDDPDTSDTNEAFDPLWGRWPQFSELLIYNYGTETRIAQVTNMYRFSARYFVHPVEDMQISAGYHFLLAYDNTLKATDGFSDSGKVRGRGNVG